MRSRCGVHRINCYQISREHGEHRENNNNERESTTIIISVRVKCPTAIKESLGEYCGKLGDKNMNGKIHSFPLAEIEKINWFKNYLENTCSLKIVCSVVN